MNETINRVDFFPVCEFLYLIRWKNVRRPKYYQNSRKKEKIISSCNPGKEGINLKKKPKRLNKKIEKI